MKTIIRFLTAAVIACVSATFAQEPPRPQPQNFVGGLTLQLTTSAHKVVQPKADAAGEQRTSFAACALLANRGNAPIVFTFPDGASAAAKFEFSLADADGNEVWRSDEGIGTAAVTEATLKRGGPWKRLVRVPLIIEGAPLAVGHYTLLAFTDADKKVSAQTVLEICAPVVKPGRGTIIGSVQKVVSSADVDPALIEPAAGVTVLVQLLPGVAGAVAQPFFWRGITDASGKFYADVPPGKYRVEASIAGVLVLPVAGAANVAVVPPPVYPPKSVVVTVEAGQAVDANILLTPAVPPPPLAQGIIGKVVRELPPEAGAPVGELPVAGARVEVSSGIQIIPAVVGFVAPPPFHWVGQTNAEGRFEVRTPVGSYRIVATKVLTVAGAQVVQVQVALGNVLPPPPILTGSAEVSVTEKKFSDVKISVKPSDVVVTPL